MTDSPSIGISDFCFLVVESAAMGPVTKELDLEAAESVPVPVSESDLIFSMHDVV